LAEYLVDIGGASHDCDSFNDQNRLYGAKDREYRFGTLGKVLLQTVKERSELSFDS